MTFVQFLLQKYNGQNNLINLICEWERERVHLIINIFSIPDFLDEDQIVQGEGGVIYVDYDIVTADYNVVEKSDRTGLIDDTDDNDDVDHEASDTDTKIDNVLENNNKLVGILKNTLEMQSFLFDKLFSYLF